MKMKKAFSKGAETELVGLGPRKPINPYMAFMAVQRREVAKANPGMPVREVVSCVAAMWRDLPQVDKQPYISRAQVDKTRFDMEKANWMTVPPKKPMNSFLCFSSEQRAHVLKANPAIPAREIAVHLANQWKQLTEHQRQPYAERAAEEKLRFQQENTRWKQQVSTSSKRKTSTASKIKKAAKSKKIKPSKDVEQFLERLKIKDKCWAKLQTQAITDMSTLQDLTQDDLRSIGLLLGDANKICRGLKEEKRVGE
eukprot:m.81221 g.81221  ORF g.81221 m.81221 type:complete len:254 (+) comp25398_c1_seq2:140-901(+)